jgi:hypothetical protein
VLDNYRLTEDAVIQGIQHLAGDILLFDEEGRIAEKVRISELLPSGKD